MSSADTDVARLFEQATIDFVVRSLVRLGAPRSELDDLAQDVMVIALSKLGVFDRDRALQPWLWGIARNRLRDYRDLARHRREIADESLDHEPGTTTEDRLVSKALRAGLASLADDMQLLIVLHDLEAWTLPECADSLGLSLDTAKYRLQVARRSLRDQLARAEKRSVS
jgi:RNA polymerase sigma-70 factor (ECF subfamily)